MHRKAQPGKRSPLRHIPLSLRKQTNLNADRYEALPLNLTTCPAFTFPRPAAPRKTLLAELLVGGQFLCGPKKPNLNDSSAFLGK